MQNSLLKRTISDLFERYIDEGVEPNIQERKKLYNELQRDCHDKVVSNIVQFPPKMLGGVQIKTPHHVDKYGIRGQYFNIWAKRNTFDILFLYPILAAFKDINYPRLTLLEISKISINYFFILETKTLTHHTHEYISGILEKSVEYMVLGASFVDNKGGEKLLLTDEIDQIVHKAKLFNKRSNNLTVILLLGKSFEI